MKKLPLNTFYLFIIILLLTLFSKSVSYAYHELPFTYIERKGSYFYLGSSYNLFLKNDVEFILNNTSAKRKIRPKETFSLHTALGYYINNWRLEAEFAYLDEKAIEDSLFIDKKLSLTPKYRVLVNALVDLPTWVPCLWVFLGGGVGVGISKINVCGIHEDDARLAFQAIGGLSFEINTFLTLTASYRLIGMARPKELYLECPSENLTYINVCKIPLFQAFELGLRINL